MLKRFAVSAAAVTLLLLMCACAAGTQIVSWCAGDADGDGQDEVLALTGAGVVAGTQMRYGDTLLIYDGGALADIRRGVLPRQEPRHAIDLARLMPMKVQLGDVNGDGINEISLCVYKTTSRDPVMAKRPFFYRLSGSNLVPVWRGSRLARPFDDYVLFDIDGDGVDELVSIERLGNGQRLVCAYQWKGFGFEVAAQSQAFSALRFAQREADALYVSHAGKTCRIRLDTQRMELLVE